MSKYERSDLPERPSELMRMLDPDRYYADDFRDNMHKGYRNEIRQPTDLLSTDAEILQHLQIIVQDGDATYTGYICGILKARHESKGRFHL